MNLWPVLDPALDPDADHVVMVFGATGSAGKGLLEVAPAGRRGLNAPPACRSGSTPAGTAIPGTARNSASGRDGAAIALDQLAEEVQQRLLFEIRELAGVHEHPVFGTHLVPDMLLVGIR